MLAAVKEIERRMDKNTDCHHSSILLERPARLRKGTAIPKIQCNIINSQCSAGGPGTENAAKMPRKVVEESIQAE